RVQVFDKSGKYLTSFGSEGDGDGELYYPYGIKFDLEQNVVIVAEYGNSRLSFFSKGGKFLGHFGERGILPGQFLGIWDIAIGKKYYYVPDYNNNRLAIIDKKYMRTFINLDK
ncbi:MAG: 6-bladed beta-propeller, partial [Candidatus Heimdallarchaeota archaeon]|nr:6-bladed beta-propeller [Candidatus Heimdallarchaeota archaeon]